MKRLSILNPRLLGMLLWLLAAGAPGANLFINEVLFNPPGPDAPNQYIELRGTPNYLIPDGTYFVAVAGDTNANPGTIRNVFDLSGRMVGPNGFLVLLQKGAVYVANTNATVLVNTGSGPGWGSDGTSSIGHTGDGGITDLEHPSVTFFLIQTTNSPQTGSDIDADNDGTGEGPQFSSWTILDSVGVLGNNGAGDIAYGLINFRRNSAALASGTIVPVGFTPVYVGRSSNTVGWVAADWVAGANLGGSATNGFTLGNGGSNTVPAAFAGAPLDHIGAPNFGAQDISGVIISQSSGSTDVSESGGTDSYTIALTTAPAGSVVIRVLADSQLQISTNGGASFGSLGTVLLNSTASKTVIVRAIDDNVVDTSPHSPLIHHNITSTSDPAHYPVTMSIPNVKVNITENDSVLLNELKVNPPGTDNPFEYVEIKGNPGALLTNVYLWVIEGNSGNNPGTLNLAVNLSSVHLGSDGLLVITSTNTPYVIPPATAIFADPRFNSPGGVLGNGSLSLLLVSSPVAVQEGKDLDSGNNGVLEGLPAGTTIMDAVAWSDGNTNDVVYGGAVLTLTGAPDAATRFPTNNTARSAAAWFYGELQGTNGNGWIYDSLMVSTNFPFGAILTPGNTNNITIGLTPLPPLSGAIGDPTNPNQTFTAYDTSPTPLPLAVTASSSNPNVAPDTNLLLSSGAGGLHFLAINPIGAGYAVITITASNAHGVGQISFPYAASLMGRPNGRFHTGSSDASTALAVDSNFMFVGDDENQVLRLYQRDISGPPLSLFDFQLELALTGQEAGEVDIEASTRVGNRLYWMGSQSNNNAAQGRTNRSRIFVTDLNASAASSTLSYIGRYDHIKEDLINWDMNNLHGKGSNYYGFAASAADGVNPKAPSGFNIEGLTMAPGSSNVAYIGFRAPLVPPSQRSSALIVIVTNFDALAMSGAPHGSAQFGPPIELNLRCRGIRSIEATTNGILISAGSPGKNTGIAPNDFRLFTWTGNPADLPQEHDTDLTGMNPEGIVEVPPPPWTASTQIQLVSDDGVTDWYGDGIEAKHLPYLNFKKFRSDWVPLGAVVVSRPSCHTFTLTNGTATLSWCAVPGLNYRVQWKAKFQDAWNDLAGDVTANASLASKSFSAGPGPQRFYRVIIP